MINILHSILPNIGKPHLTQIADTDRGAEALPIVYIYFFIHSFNFLLLSQYESCWKLQIFRTDYLNIFLRRKITFAHYVTLCLRPLINTNLFYLLI